MAVLRSLAVQPALLLADEPSGNLDSKSADAVFEPPRSVNREDGTAIPFVTHHAALAERRDRTMQVVDGLLAVRDPDPPGRRRPGRPAHCAKDGAARSQGVRRQGALSCARPIQMAQESLAAGASPAGRMPQPQLLPPPRRSHNQGPASIERLAPRANSAITSAPSRVLALIAVTSRAEWSKPHGNRAQAVPSALAVAALQRMRLTERPVVYAMLSKKTHYVDKTVDYEALMVARNAPRWLQMLVKHGFMPAPA